MPSATECTGYIGRGRGPARPSGMEMSMENRCGSYLQMNQDVVHAECREEGIEVLSYKKAMEKYDWLRDYNWKAVDKDKDEITKYVAAQDDPKG